MLRDSLARSGALVEPRRWSCCALSLGVARDMGLEVGSCRRGQGVAPTCRAAGCRSPLSRIPRAAYIPRGWMGVLAGGSLWRTAAVSGARTSALAAPGKGCVCVCAKSQHDGRSQNAPQRRGWPRIVPALLVVAAFGRKPTEKPLLNVVFWRRRKPEGKNPSAPSGICLSPEAESRQLGSGEGQRSSSLEIAVLLQRKKIC